MFGRQLVYAVAETSTVEATAIEAKSFLCLENPPQDYAYMWEALRILFTLKIFSNL